MSEQTLVSVVMVVLEPQPIYFLEAVSSVLAQTYEELELVIIEDPSTRSAGELLSQFSDHRIRHCCNPTRTSFIAQKNQALACARGSLVAVMDADDVCHPRRLQAQVEFLRLHGDISVLGSQLEVIDTSSRCIGWRQYPLDHMAIMRAMTLFNPIAHPSVMFRRDAVLAGGGYQYKGPWAAADYELWSRLARAGIRFANHPEPLLKYRIHRDSSKATALRDTIRGTLDVKERYWRDKMGWGGRLRMHTERAMLILPPRFVFSLFYHTQYRDRRPIPVVPGTH